MVLNKWSEVTIKSFVNEVVTQSETPNRTQRRVSKTRNRLLKAASSVFAEVGTDAATIEMITQRADLGKGTFYRHFADKSEIIAVLIEQCIDDLVAAVLQAAREPHSLREVLDGLVNGHMEFFLGHRDEYVLLFQGRMLLKLDRGLVYEIDQPYEHYLNRIEDLVRPFLPTLVDSIKVRRLACAIAGFVSGFLSFAMITMEPRVLRESIEPMRGAFLAGVVGFMERP
ncbi:MAG: TetR/AcrR family transcriptional regulator [Phycisphaerae bacterium]|nr:TetR/AcrR family transcriptional regulator [Phycisphaerae bacterium]